MHDKNDPVARMGEVLAMLFAYMSQSIINHVGEEKGREIIEESIYRFGFDRGQAIRKKVIDDGKKLTFDNFEAYYDIPDNHGWDGQTTVDGNVLIEHTKYCPFAKKWIELEMEELGSMYCAVDESMMKGYFGEIKFQRLKLFNSDMNRQCEMKVEI